MLCTLDSGTTVTTTFGFTALTILGGSAKAIRTTTPGLGIAIHYNGKIVSPSDSFTETFTAGVTNIDLEFEAVRDPTMPIKDIATGGFTASAIMVMTEN